MTDRLAQNLNLSQYQINRLKIYKHKYNVARLQKRGGVLYAPYLVRGLWHGLYCAVFGVRADLIGKDRVLLQAQRNIKFCANGYHAVKVGRYIYYADANGCEISRDEFMQNLKR